MIFSKDTPIGIDFMIDKMQNAFNSKLTWDNPYIYGRVYINTKGGVNVAEAHISKKTYKQIFVDKAKSTVIGFVERGDIDFNGKVQTSEIDIICTLNLDKVYGVNSRNDEEALQTLVKIVQGVSGWEITKVRKGNVKSVFDFMETKDITYRDMQPYANFAISCKVNYLNNICKL